MEKIIEGQSAFQGTVDSHGHLVCWSAERIKDVDSQEVTYGAYAACPFITLPKEDVENLISILKEAIDDKWVISRNDPRCISFERLVDREIGVIYPDFAK